MRTDVNHREMSGGVMLSNTAVDVYYLNVLSPVIKRNGILNFAIKCDRILDRLWSVVSVISVRPSTHVT